MSDSESPAAGVNPVVGAGPAAGGGLLVPALLFGFYLMAAASGGALLAAGTRIYELTAGWTASSGLALVVTIALGAILGSSTAGRRAGRTAAPGATLALLQASFGLAVLLSVLLFRGARAGYLELWPSIGGSDAGAWGLRFVLALALLFLPATLFFGMQPMLARLIVAGRQGYGIACGFAFGLSLAGLALGTVAGGGLFLPNLGIHGSLLMGVALSGLAAAGTTLVRQRGLEGPGALGANLSGGEPAPGVAPQDEEALIDDEIIAGGTLAAANILVGFAAWGYLIAWSRTLTFIVGGTTQSKATIAGIYLLGLALGAFLISGIVERIGRLLISLTILLMASSMVAHVSMYLAAPAAMLYLRLSPFLDRPGLSELPTALTAASLMLPACLLLGGALPLLPLVAREKGRPMAGTISFLAIGVILADLTIGMFVVPAFGLRRTVSLAGAVGLLSAILFVGAVPFRRPALRTTCAVGLLGLMVVLGGFPASWDPRVISAGLYRYGARALERFRTPEQYMAARRTVEVLFYREGRNASVMVERTMQSPAPGAPPSETIALTVDGKVDATTGEDLRAQILQAHIPILIHGPARSVLLIRFLTGVSAGSILRHPVTAVSILEPEPVLFEAAAAFTDYNRRPLEDSRVARLVDDPRARLLVEGTAYDVIIVGAMDPWLPQSAALLTDEGYRLLGSRLRPGGLVAQRISVSSTSEEALKAVLRTFMRAFGSVLAFQTSPEDLLLLGSSEPLGIDAGWIRNVLGSSASVAQDLGRALPLGVNGVLLQFRGGGRRCAR